MVLLKPSDRGERTVDALAHYHKRISRSRDVSGVFGNGIATELSWNYFFLVWDNTVTRSVQHPTSQARVPVARESRGSAYSMMRVRAKTHLQINILS